MGLAMLVKKSHLNADQQEVADIIGLENYQALVDTFGGSQIWIPKARSLVSSPEISTYIRSRRQNGDTPEQIARELELPVSEVRRLSKGFMAHRKRGEPFFYVVSLCDFAFYKDTFL